MYLGRVITKSKKVPVVDFVELTPQREVLDGFPTLIIGKDVAEEMFGSENVKVLDKNISENVMWTFLKTERRSDYEKDVERFNQEVINHLKKQIEYKYFNIFTESVETSKKFIDFLYKNKRRKHIYRNGKHIYVYPEGANVVYGFSLESVDYIGKSGESAMEKIEENRSNVVFDDDNFIGVKLARRINNDRTLIPYLHFVAGK